MASTIRIKRSGNTTSPTTLASGELAYSWAAGAGGKLYLGWGDEITVGQAPNIAVVGGKYFTDILDHTAGTLTASSAIIVDASSKINQLFVDNISVDGNTITTTDTNGNLVFNTNGSGVFSFSSKRITDVAAPVNPNDAVTLGYLTSTFSSALNIVGDTGSDSISLTSETLDFNGGTGISTAVTANTITFNLTNTGVNAGSYGSATIIPTFTVNAQGRVSAAANVSIAIPSTQITDFTEAVQDVAGGMVTGSTQNGISVTYDDGTGKINFDVNDPTITLSGDVAGSATMTNLGNVTITTTIQANSVALGADTTGNYVASLVQGTGVTITNNTGETATPTIAIGQDVSPSANVVFASVNLTGSMQIDGNLIVSGNTVTISTQSLAVRDNLIYLNEPETESIINAVGSGTSVTYTVSGVNTFETGQVVTISGIDPSQYNRPNPSTILSSNTTAFTILSTATGTYISGGIAEARTSANPDLGFVGNYNDGTYAHAGFFRDATDGRFKVFKGYTPEPGAFIDTSNNTFQLAEMQASIFYGDLSGNAATASKLLTARTITLNGDLGGSVSFDGSANVTITTAITANTITNVDIASDAAIAITKLAASTISGISLGNNLTNATFNNGGTGDVSGTTYNGGTARTISYNTVGASPLAGSTSLTTVGTITGSGVWNASIITPTYGGTGVNNGTRTLTVNTANVAFTAAAGGSSVTLPSIGTLATLDQTETFNGTKTFSAAVTFSGTTVNYALGTSQTTGTFDIGGTAQTGAITVGRSTATQVVNLATGATSTGNTKTVNIGTGGVTGSTTNISIGSEIAGTTTVYSPTLSANNITAIGTITGSLSGNATTASRLQTARTITLAGDVGGSVSFDGSANVSITTTVQPNSVALGTDTTGDYVAFIANTVSSGVLVSGTAGEGSTFTVSGIDATLTVKGVASFGGYADDANTIRQFSLTGGNVSIVSLDGGTF